MIAAVAVAKKSELECILDNYQALLDLLTNVASSKDWPDPGPA